MRQSGFYLSAIIVLVALVIFQHAAIAQSAPPTSVAGTITVNGVPTNGVSVSGGGGSDTTHHGGRYAFDVTPGTITVTATYQGYSSSVSFTIASGGFQPEDINIVIPTATATPTPTPTPTATPTPTPTPITTPTATPTAVTQSSQNYGGFPSSVGTYGYGASSRITTATPTPAPKNNSETMVTATPDPTSTPVSSITVTPSPASATATPAPASSSGLNSMIILAGVLAAVAIAVGAIYILNTRRQ